MMDDFSGNMNSAKNSVLSINRYIEYVLRTPRSVTAEKCNALSVHPGCVHPLNPFNNLISFRSYFNIVRDGV